MTVQHRTAVTGWVAVLTLAVASSAAGASSPRPSGDVARHRTGEVVRDWNDIARSQPFGNPLRLARILAVMHAAQHDAVNGAQPRYQTYVSTLHDLGADAEAAAAAAAHEVLVAFFPANHLTLDDRLAESLSTVPDGHAEDAGVVLGGAVADLILDGAR